MLYMILCDGRTVLINTKTNVCLFSNDAIGKVDTMLDENGIETNEFKNAKALIIEETKDDYWAIDVTYCENVTAQ